MKKKGRFCYTCGDPATTTEHVPPKSFFPEGFRENLITVPSCYRHNNENSSDVEYVRRILVNQFETSQEVIDLLNPKVWRSFKRSPNLLRTTFRDIEPLIFNGQQTAAFKIDFPRFNRVMSAIASGIYFHKYGRRFFGSWVIFCSSTYGTDEIQTGKPNQFQELREALTRLKLETIYTKQPTFFTGGVSFDSYHQLVLELQFFSGIKVHAISVPIWRNMPKKTRR